MATTRAARLALAGLAAAVAVSAASLATGWSRARARRAIAPRVEPPPALAREPVRAASGAVGSTIALAEIAGRTIALVADEDEGALLAVDLAAPGDAGPRVGTYPLGAAPGQIVVSRGGEIYVAVRGASRVIGLALLASGSLHAFASAETASEPIGLALTPDGGTLLVATGWGHTLEALRPTDLVPVFVREIAREPRGVVVTGDGARAFVSHAVGSVATVVDLATAEHAARSIPLAMKERRRDFGSVPAFLPMARPMRFDDDFDPFGGRARPEEPARPVEVTFTRHANQGLSLAAVGGDVLFPEALVLPGDDEVSFSGYGSAAGSTLPTHVPFVGRVDAAKESLREKAFSGPAARGCFEDDPTPRCLLPTASAVDRDALLIACAGIDRVVRWDPTVRYDDGEDCVAHRKARRSWPVAGHPTGLAVHETTRAVYTWSQADRAITRVDPEADGTSTFPVPARDGAPVLGLAFARGRELFFTTGDPRISKNGRGCASCHVDGRQDELVWPTPFGKRQTPMLAGRLEGTAPYSWNGSHDTLAQHIDSTIRNLEGSGVDENDLAALAAFAREIPGPHVRASAGMRVAEGRRVFESSEAGCSSCHASGSRFSDRERHAFPDPSNQSFDTPSLAFVGGTPPYFHDGRYATLAELVDKCDGKMGNTAHLDAKEKEALVSYLKSL